MREIKEWDIDIDEDLAIDMCIYTITYKVDVYTYKYMNCCPAPRLEGTVLDFLKEMSQDNAPPKGELIDEDPWVEIVPASTTTFGGSVVYGTSSWPTSTAGVYGSVTNSVWYPAHNTSSGEEIKKIQAYHQAQQQKHLEQLANIQQAQSQETLRDKMKAFFGRKK